MGGFVTLLIKGMDKYDSQGIICSTLTYWVSSFIMIVISIIAFVYARKLGRQEDELNRARNSDIETAISQSRRIRKDRST